MQPTNLTKSEFTFMYLNGKENSSYRLSFWYTKATLAAGTDAAKVCLVNVISRYQSLVLKQKARQAFKQTTN